MQYSSASLDNCGVLDGCRSMKSKFSGSLHQKEKSGTKNNPTFNKIVIDLQKEFEEDQELLELLQPKKPRGSMDQKQTGIKALFELKQSKIEIIPEEDEEKLKPEQKLFISKDRDSKKSNANNIDNKFIFSNRFFRKKQLDIFNNKDNSGLKQHKLSTQISKLNADNERKEIAVLLSPPSRKDLNGCLITNDKSNESPSTSGITHDSIKRPNMDQNVKYGFLTQKMDLIKHNHDPSNNHPKKNPRPLSNPHSSNLNLRREENMACNQNVKGIINDFIHKREFSQKERKRTKLGSAPSQSNYTNEKLFKCRYKSNDVKSNISSLHQMHKIKIERGIASSKLIEKFSKQLSYDYTNDLNKNNKGNFNRHNEPIKVIQM